MNPRSLVAIGTGIGIEILGQELHVTVVRVRPTGARVLGHAAIAGFRQRPASEWGAEYAAFLRRLGAGHLAAAVLLPRTEVIVRQLNFAGVAGRDLISAVPLQVDSLHPYGDDEAGYGWARLPGSGTVLIGIAHRAVVERYSRLFLEAGIKIASFSFSAAALYSASRILHEPPAEGFLATGGESETEAYGESQAKPVFSAVLEAPLERAVTLAASELRLDPGTSLLTLAELLPKPRTAPADFDLGRAALGYATALASACPQLSLKVNLLPVELRSSNSRVMLVPTVALAAMLLVMAVALAAQGKYEERRQLDLLSAEIARFEPRAKKAEAAERAVEMTRRRVQALDRFHRRTRADLDTLEEITRLIEMPGWLNALEMDAGTVTIGGQTEQAAPLLKLLDNSPLFQNSEFVGQIGKAEKNEVFRIRTSREEVAR